MKRPAFVEGVLLAVTLGVAGRVTYTGLHLFLSGRQALLIVIAMLALLYVTYLFKRSQERVGRITVFSCWLLLTAILCISQPPFTVFILAQAAMLWLVRSLYYYSSVLSTLADLVLTGLALVTVVWGVDYTGSLLFCIWAFFLIQALFVTIPPNWAEPGGVRKRHNASEDRFEQAYSSAQTAIQKLSSQ